jgi:hypothetical protein
MTPEQFFAHRPTQLARIGDFGLYEHPTRGDEVPIYMYNFLTRYMINTGFYDLGDFDLALCMELESAPQ